MSKRNPSFRGIAGWHDERVIALEILSVLAAVLALAFALWAAKSTHSEAKDELTHLQRPTSDAEAARAKAVAFHAEADRLSIQGKQPEAQAAIRQRDAQNQLAGLLEASLERPLQTEAAKQVTLTRRALNGALIAAFLGTASAVLGGAAGIVGAPQQTEGTPAPSPTATR